MNMAEEFERCEKCHQGWFEKKDFVLVKKGATHWGKPTLYKTEVQLHCVGCGHIQYKYSKNDY